MKVKYMAFDGMSFDSPNECATYEKKYAREYVEENIKVYDFRGNEYSILNHELCGDIIFVKTEEAHEIYQYLKDTEPFYNESIEYLSRGWYFWDENNESWESYEEYKRIIDGVTRVMGMERKGE